MSSNGENQESEEELRRSEAAIERARKEYQRSADIERALREALKRDEDGACKICQS